MRDTHSLRPKPLILIGGMYFNLTIYKEVFFKDFRFVVYIVINVFAKKNGRELHYQRFFSLRELSPQKIMATS